MKKLKSAIKKLFFQAKEYKQQKLCVELKNKLCNIRNFYVSLKSCFFIILFNDFRPFH